MWTFPIFYILPIALEFLYYFRKINRQVQFRILIIACNCRNKTASFFFLPNKRIKKLMEKRNDSSV